VLWRKLSPDGRVLLTWHLGMLRIWDTEPFSQLGTLPIISTPSYNAFSSDSRQLALGFADGRVTLLEIPSLKIMRTFPAHKGAIDGIAFSSDAKFLTTRGADGAMTVWDRKRVTAITNTASSLRGLGLLSFSQDGKTILGSDIHGHAEIWAFGKSSPRSWEAHREAVTAIELSSGGETIMTAGAESFVKIWDARTLSLLTSHRGSLQTVTSMAFSPDRRRMVTGAEGAIKIWDAETWQELATFPVTKGHPRIWSLAFHADGSALVAASNEGVYTWRTAPVD